MRADHVARYEWACERVKGHVIDAGCNCGYGAAILADAGLRVTAIDNWAEGLAFAKEWWDRPAITWQETNLEAATLVSGKVDAVVAFEIIEHLGNPYPLLAEARRAAPLLLASVPNEDVWPHTPRLAPAHKRHYTRAQFGALLLECGWSTIEWWGQDGGESPVERDVSGRTLVVECR